VRPRRSDGRQAPGREPLAAARSAAKPARIPARDLLLTYRDDKGDLTARTVRHRAVRRAATGLLVEADCCLAGPSANSGRSRRRPRGRALGPRLPRSPRLPRGP
jgi:hypothetical protein